jgi:hypothetical protein
VGAGVGVGGVGGRGGGGGGGGGGGYMSEKICKYLPIDTVS